MLNTCRLFASVVFLAAPVSVALADASSSPYREGGYVPDFVKIVRQYNASGEQFRIEGICKSACTRAPTAKWMNYRRSEIEWTNDLKQLVP
jgi:hypothetical protein